MIARRIARRGQVSRSRWLVRSILPDGGLGMEEVASGRTDSDHRCQLSDGGSENHVVDGVRRSRGSLVRVFTRGLQFDLDLDRPALRAGDLRPGPAGVGDLEDRIDLDAADGTIANVYHLSGAPTRGLPVHLPRVITILDWGGHGPRPRYFLWVLRSARIACGPV